MAWKSFGITTAIDLPNPSSGARTGDGAYINRTPIPTGTVIGNTNGIVMDLAGCMGMGNLNNPYANPQSLCRNYPIITAFSSYTDGFYHGTISGTFYNYISLVDIYIILADDDPKEFSSLTDVNTHSVVISNGFTSIGNSGLTTDYIIHSDNADNSSDGYSCIYVSGSNPFPDYIFNYGTYESYCYPVSLATGLTLADVNNYISQGYIYPGIKYTLSKYRYNQITGGPATNGYAYSYISQPNQGGVAEMASQFNGISATDNSSTWKTSSEIYVRNANDAWVSAENIYIHNGSSWQEVPKTSTMIWH